MTFTATTWVPRGFASEHPQRHVMNKEEMDKLAKMAQLQIDDAKADLEDARDAAPKSTDALKDTEEIDEDLKEYDLENYDNEEDSQGQLMGVFGNARDLEYHENDQSSGGDPYITMKPNDPEDDEDEREELQILPSDNLILATKTENDLSCLEVYVYDDEAVQAEDGPSSRNDLYVHHDFMLPAEPLCVEWLDYKVGTSDEKPGNFAAIGTFEPEIEIWNLDVVDGVYPEMILGQIDASEDTVKKGRKKKNTRKVNDRRHIDAVLSLSSNKMHRNLLASASADTTVKLWDLNTGACAKSFQYHDDKVSCVAWNPKESTVLLSGGYDHQVIVADARVEGDEGQRKWKVNGDVESVKWSSDGKEFYVATEYGQLHKFDARNESESLWTLQAHDNDITSFDVNEHISGLLATASQDKTVKLWNMSNDRPSMLLSRDLDVGKVFSVQFAPDPEVAGHLSAAGTNGSVKVWDTFTNRYVRESLGSKMAELAASRENRKETVASVTLDDDSDSGFEDVEDDVEEDE